MAALGSQSIASSYEQLLHTDADGGGNGTTLVSVKDGDNGTTFDIQLSSNSTNFQTDFQVGGTAVTSTAAELNYNDITTLGTAQASKALTADASGIVKNPNQPAFLVRPASSQLNIAADDSLVTVVFGTEVFDQGGDFASNTFTAPIAGRYQLNASVYLISLDSAAGYYELQIITSNRTYFNIIDPDFGQDAAYFSINISVLADMDASDTALVEIRQSSGTAQADIATPSYFSGYLAC